MAQNYDIARLSGELAYFEATRGVVVRGIHASAGDKFELPKQEVDYLVRTNCGKRVAKSDFFAKPAQK